MKRRNQRPLGDAETKSWRQLVRSWLGALHLFPFRPRQTLCYQVGLKCTCVSRLCNWSHAGSSWSNSLAILLGTPLQAPGTLLYCLSMVSNTLCPLSASGLRLPLLSIVTVGSCQLLQVLLAGPKGRVRPFPTGWPNQNVTDGRWQPPPHLPFPKWTRGPIHLARPVQIN